jgi:hypothetical protein
MFGSDFGNAVDRLLLDSGLTGLLAILLPALHVGALALWIRQKRAPALLFVANIVVAGLVAFYYLAQPEYWGDILDFSDPALAALVAFAFVTIAMGFAGLHGWRVAVVYSGVIFAIDLAILVLGGVFALLFSSGEHR